MMRINGKYLPVCVGLRKMLVDNEQSNSPINSTSKNAIDPDVSISTVNCSEELIVFRCL